MSQSRAQPRRVQWSGLPRNTGSASSRSTPGESTLGRPEAVDVKRLRQLELENAKLKKLVAERDLEIDVMKEVAARKW